MAAPRRWVAIALIALCLHASPVSVEAVHAAAHDHRAAALGVKGGVKGGVKAAVAAGAGAVGGVVGGGGGGVTPYGDVDARLLKAKPGTKHYTAADLREILGLPDGAELPVAEATMLVLTNEAIDSGDAAGSDLARNIESVRDVVRAAVRDTAKKDAAFLYDAMKGAGTKKEGAVIATVASYEGHDYPYLAEAFAAHCREKKSEDTSLDRWLHDDFSGSQLRRVLLAKEGRLGPHESAALDIYDNFKHLGTQSEARACLAVAYAADEEGGVAALAATFEREARGLGSDEPSLAAWVDDDLGGAWLHATKAVLEGRAGHTMCLATELHDLMDGAGTRSERRIAAAILEAGGAEDRAQLQKDFRAVCLREQLIPRPDACALRAYLEDDLSGALLQESLSALDGELDEAQMAAYRLYAAMKGAGTDEELVAEVVGSFQRAGKIEELAAAFEDVVGRMGKSTDKGEHDSLLLKWIDDDMSLGWHDMTVALYRGTHTGSTADYFLSSRIGRRLNSFLKAKYELCTAKSRHLLMLVPTCQLVVGGTLVDNMLARASEALREEMSDATNGNTMISGAYVLYVVVGMARSLGTRALNKDLTGDENMAGVRDLARTLASIAMTVVTLGAFGAGSLVMKISNAVKAAINALVEIGSKLLGVLGKVGRWLAEAYRRARAAVREAVRRVRTWLGLSPSEAGRGKAAALSAETTTVVDELAGKALSKTKSQVRAAARDLQELLKKRGSISRQVSKTMTQKATTVKLFERQVRAISESSRSLAMSISVATDKLDGMMKAIGPDKMAA